MLSAPIDNAGVIGYRVSQPELFGEGDGHFYVAKVTASTGSTHCGLSACDRPVKDFAEGFVGHGQKGASSLGSILLFGEGM
jgi:hypothetical protein